MSAKKDAIRNNLHPFEESRDVCRSAAVHIKQAQTGSINKK
jgi:hypothetical protein